MINRSMFIGAIALFLLLLVPYFQNIGEGILLLFFGAEVPYHSGFWILVAGGMVLWALITLLVQWFIQDVKDSVGKNKFEM